MVLQLSEVLDVPLRARNELLLAAGYAPVYGQTDLEAPEMASVRQAMDLVLRHAEPFPALVVDRHWNLVRANAGVGLMLQGVAQHLLVPPVNLMRVSLHPDGLAPLVEQWSGLGTELCRRLLVRARNRFVGKVHMLCLLDNRRVQRIARVLGGELTFYPGEVEARLEPPWPDPTSAAEEWLDEAAALLRLGPLPLPPEVGAVAR